MIQKISSILLLLLVSNNGFAQINQSILMLGGQEIIGVPLDQSPEEIVLKTDPNNAEKKPATENMKTLVLLRFQGMYA